ncbi:MAG: HNH endonuclease [Pseudomonadota bacterium]
MQWCRLHADMLDDPKVQLLPATVFKAWVNILCLATKADGDGRVGELGDIAFALRCDTDATRSALGHLTQQGLLAESAAGVFSVVNWRKRQFQSDDSADRVRRYRQRRKKLGLTSNGYAKHADTVMERDGHACVYCGATESLCIDHVIPIAQGGGDALDNLACACKSCNSGKAGRTPEQAKYQFVNAEAAARYREHSRRVTVTVTAPETETDTETEQNTSSLRSEDNAHADGASDRPCEQQSRAKTPERGEQAKRAMTEDFKAFWDVYPRQVSKGRALKAFPKARKLVDQSTLIAAVQRYAARVRGKDAEFVAYPATWLNDQRWLDQEPDNEGRRSSETQPDSHADRGERIAALVRSRYGGTGVCELSGPNDLGVLPGSGREIAG